MPRRKVGPEGGFSSGKVYREPIGPDDYVDPLGRRRAYIKVRMMEYDPETGEQLGMTDTWAPKDDRRCQAKSRNGPFQKQQCRGYAILGGKVCYHHGGSIPNVKKAAAAKLALAANPAIEALIHIALTKKGVVDADRIRAICQILDRAGITGKTEVTIEVKPWQDMLRRIAGMPAGEMEGDSDSDAIEAEWWEDPDEQEDDPAPVRPTRRTPQKRGAKSRG